MPKSRARFSHEATGAALADGGASPRGASATERCDAATNAIESKAARIARRTVNQFAKRARLLSKPP
jgi:hypothetical protein